MGVGVKLEVVKDILGHEDTKTTIKYLGLNYDDQTDAMKKLAQYQKSLFLPEKVILATSQQRKWAQGDLYPQILLDEKNSALFASLRNMER